MTPKELIKYELPSVTEFVSTGWVQTLIAWYYARKVNKKWKRYQARLDREKWIKDKLLKTN